MLIFRHFPYWILIIVSNLEYSKLQLRTCDITLETKYGYDIYLEEKKPNLTVYDSTRTIKQFSLVNIFGRIKLTQNMKKRKH